LVWILRQNASCASFWRIGCILTLHDVRYACLTHKLQSPTSFLS
jgi:hypothetical protein